MVCVHGLWDDGVWREAVREVSIYPRLTPSRVIRTRMVVAVKLKAVAESGVCKFTSQNLMQNHPPVDPRHCILNKFRHH